MMTCIHASKPIKLQSVNVIKYTEKIKWNSYTNFSGIIQAT